MIDPAVVEGLRYPLMALAALAGAFSVLLIVTSWQSLPESVPAHFGLTGRPDRWSGRWVLFLMVAIQTGTIAAMLFVQNNELLFAWCMALTSILMAYVVWEMIRIAQKRAEKLNLFALYGLLAMLAVPALMSSLLTGK